jgi:hypothetical protein
LVPRRSDAAGQADTLRQEQIRVPAESRAEVGQMPIEVANLGSFVE